MSEQLSPGSEHAEWQEPTTGTPKLPSKYEGLPSAVVEELWTPPTYIDPGKDQAIQEQRGQAIAELRNQEAKSQSPETLTPPQEQALFAIADYLQGGKQIEAQLTAEEKGLLDKMRPIYEQAKATKPDVPVAFQFSQPEDEELYAQIFARISENVTTTSEKESPGKTAFEKLSPYIEARIQRAEAGRRTSTAEAFRATLEKWRQDPETHMTDIAKYLAAEIYKNLREADYVKGPGYDAAWQLATTDATLPARVENGWVYRGEFPSRQSGSTTETRGSMNVEVSPELVGQLDSLIKNGEIRANYKFGEPGNSSEASERHDAITIYFLEQPSDEALAKLSVIAGEHFRGNNLLGHKVSEGFSLSEVGSVSDKDIPALLSGLDAVDPRLGVAMKSFLTSRSGRIAMSEAQFYATKEALQAYGYDIGYDQANGFTLASNPLGEVQPGNKIDEKAFGEFRVKNGENDSGSGHVWYEYKNAAAKQLETEGRFKWGEQRLYLETPINSMSTLRDAALRIATEQKIPIAFKHLDADKTPQLFLADDSTRFVANFASAEDARRFYEALALDPTYAAIQTDREVDYHSLNLDGKAHYASGFREKRVSLENVINSSVQNPDGNVSYSYVTAEGKARTNTISLEQYQKFVQEYNEMDPVAPWNRAGEALKQQKANS